jgi:hypothetical protein
LSHVVPEDGEELILVVRGEFRVDHRDTPEGALLKPFIQ